MSCGLNELTEERDKVKYVGCQMKFGADRTGQKCAAGSNLNWKALSMCRDSAEGANLQLQAEQLQKRLIDYPDFVPTIVLNQQFSKSLQNRLIRNFKKTICGLIESSSEVCSE